MSKILVMNENLANKIAAGEVVEKVVSVVKELVENSIDAKATEIKIELIDSGVKEIKVTDNGIGMDKEDAVLCFSRHATSKLKQEEDLFNIESLGFRGEALPSIASVSRVTLSTSNGIDGTEVIINGGISESVKKIDKDKGTTIKVEDLFYNTPVRFKYLKNLYTELSYITDYLDKMALSFPNIKFKLINNDKLLLNTDGSGNLLKVIGKVYGIEVAKKMIEVSVSDDDYTVNGYISMPEITRTNRNSITTFVNNRLIKNNEINKIIIEAYHDLIHASRVPIVVLSIDVDPSLVDVNIHPTKMDIKFSKFEELKVLITDMIRDKLIKKDLSKSIPEVKKDINDYVEETKVVEEIPYTRVEEIQLDFETHEDSDISLTDIILNKGKNRQERLKKMNVIGYLHSTYILAENEDGLFIVDQHAAAERINYEKYLSIMGTPKDIKVDMLVPLKLEFTTSDYLILKENFDKLEQLNFEIEEFGINTIQVRTHPYWLDEDRLTDSIRNIIDVIIKEKDFNTRVFNEKLAQMAACKSSIRANEYIDHERQQNLLDKLIECDNPFNCAHGRPTIIKYTSYDLEKYFMRCM